MPIHLGVIAMRPRAVLRTALSNHVNQELCELPVKELACANAQLHLWTTNSFLREALDLMDAWGFTYKTNLIWVKPQIGLVTTGVTPTRSYSSESGRDPFLDASVRSWHLHSRLTHSEKPELFRGLIEQVANGPYLELFGRRHPGSSHWTVFGNDVAGAQTPCDEESLRSTRHDTTPPIAKDLTFPTAVRIRACV